MRKFLSCSLLTALSLMAAPTSADTLHLKNGSVIKGRVTSFADDQFVVMIETGSGRYLSKAQIYVGDVARIEFDSATMPAADSPTRVPAVVQPEDSTSRQTPSTSTPTESQAKPGVETSTGGGNPNVSKPPPSDPEAAPAEKTPIPTAPSVPVSETPESKSTDQVLTASVDVMAKRDWTSTGLIVKRGDKIRITATGTVTLDAAGGRTSGPEGIEVPDSRKLMADRPTGALIAVIGADNDDFIFVGKQIEFAAARDGLLFLSVNEGALADNSGAFQSTIEVLTKLATAR